MVLDESCIRRPIGDGAVMRRQLDRLAESAQRGHLERDNKFVVPLLAAYQQLQAEVPSQAASVAMIKRLRKSTP